MLELKERTHKVYMIFIWIYTSFQQIDCVSNLLKYIIYDLQT